MNASFMNKDVIRSTRAGNILAGLPVSLVATELEEQLANPDVTYSSADNFGQLVDTFTAINMRRDELDEDEFETVRTSFFSICSRTLDALSTRWGIDFQQLGVSHDDHSGIHELFRFTFCERIENSEDCIFNALVMNQRQLVKNLKPQTVKRDQSVASLRRQLENFDDVVMAIWFSKLVGDTLEEGGPAGTFSEVLATIGSTSAFLSALAEKIPDEDFAARYVKPLADSSRLASLKANLTNRWISISKQRTTQLNLDAQDNDD